MLPAIQLCVTVKPEEHRLKKKKKVWWVFFFLTVKWSFLYFSLCQLPLVLSLDSTEKSLAQSASLHPTSYSCTLIRFFLSLFFSRLNNSSASFCFSRHSFLHVSYFLGSGHAFVAAWRAVRGPVLEVTCYFTPCGFNPGEVCLSVV